MSNLSNQDKEQQHKLLFPTGFVITISDMCSDNTEV